MSMQIEIITTSSRLAEIGPAWDALWSRSSQSVFQSHGWIMAWFGSRRPGDQSRLCIGLCWDESRLLAAMPFITRRHRGVRVLEWAAKECSDYCDAIADPDPSAGWRALEKVWAAVVASTGFDVAYLSHIRPDAAVGMLFAGWSRSMRLKPGHRSARSLQVGNGGASGHGWFRALNKKARNNHTRGMRILGETGAVTVRVNEAGHVADAVLERMITLKQEWLVSTGQKNEILDNDALVLRALIKELDRQKVLQVFSIHCDEAIVAGSLNIVSGTRMQAFFAAYDPAFDRASPGTLVMVEYLTWAFNQGMTEVDFLCGEEQYKFKFATTQTDLVSYVGARTWVGSIALAVGERLDKTRQPGKPAELVLPGKLAGA
jgi:CelD/BcsL family acetyltransferase involved in cellulose biosynthesis